MLIALGVYFFLVQKAISAITGTGIMIFVFIISCFLSVSIEKVMTNMPETKEYSSQSYTLQWFEDHLIMQDIINANDSINLRHLKCDNYLLFMIMVILIYSGIYSSILKII